MMVKYKYKMTFTTMKTPQRCGEKKRLGREGHCNNGCAYGFFFPFLSFLTSCILKILSQMTNQFDKKIVFSKDLSI